MDYKAMVEEMMRKLSEVNKRKVAVFARTLLEIQQEKKTAEAVK